MAAHALTSPPSEHQTPAAGPVPLSPAALDKQSRLLASFSKVEANAAPAPVRRGAAARRCGTSSLCLHAVSSSPRAPATSVRGACPAGLGPFFPLFLHTRSRLLPLTSWHGPETAGAFAVRYHCMRGLLPGLVRSSLCCWGPLGTFCASALGENCLVSGCLFLGCCGPPHHHLVWYDQWWRC